MEISYHQMSLLLVAILMLVASGNAAENLQTATCNVTVNSAIPAGINDMVTGSVTLTELPDGKTKLEVELAGFDTADANLKHGFHIHQTDNLTVGCNSLGGHFNPTNSNHGSPTATTRHYGDLGNVREDPAGRVSVVITDHLVTLHGANSVVGRSVVVHQNIDDLGQGGDSGSAATGNAGSRLACCIIQRTSASPRLSPPATLLTILALLWVALH